MTKAEKYEKYFMDIALRTAENSYVVCSKVGAVLVKDNHIVATSWNGTPSGMDNCCEYTNEDGSLTCQNLSCHFNAARLVPINYIDANIYTLIANINTSTGNQLFNLVLAFTAKRTM